MRVIGMLIWCVTAACSGPAKSDSGVGTAGGGVGGDGTDGGDGGVDGGTGSGADGGSGPPVILPGTWEVVSTTVNGDECGIAEAFSSTPVQVTAASERGWDLTMGMPDAPLRLRCAWDGTYWSAGPAEDELPGGTVRVAELWGARDGDTEIFGSLFFSAQCREGGCTDETAADCSSELDFSLRHAGD